MTKVAVWCRHQGDNIIGQGNHLPWYVPSDLKRFSAIVSGQNLVMGRVTYESLPSAFDNEKIFVLTSNPQYKLRSSSHELIDDIRFFKDFEEDLYICGGAKVYNQFLTLSPKLMPDIIVDCIYQGEINFDEKNAVEITSSIEVLNKKYFKMTQDFSKDNVTTALYVKRDDFVEQSVLKRLLAIIEQDY